MEMGYRETYLMHGSFTRKEDVNIYIYIYAYLK